ncbi:MAG: GntR family transcriptional regulator [Trueperaceae bacterium]
MVEKRTLGDQVAQILREGILTGEFEPGQRLSEPDLANRLNVSLTPVREALGTLAATGLIVRNGRQGTHVRKLDVEDIENLLAVRETLEVLAVRQSIPNLTEEDDGHMQYLVAEQTKATERVKVDLHSALPRLSALNDEFHELILARTRNEWLINMLASIQDLLVFSRSRLRFNATLERRQASLAEHRGIAQALVRRDSDGAARRMSEHVRHLKEHVIALVPEVQDRERQQVGSQEEPR